MIFVSHQNAGFRFLLIDKAESGIEMKNIVLVFVNVFLGILTLMMVMTVYGRMHRSIELNSNLSSAVEETVENMTVNKKYDIHNTDEFLADFIQTFLMALDAQSDIMIDVLQCDKEKGILDIRVTASYLHPNGKKGTVTCERTVILNRLMEQN